MAITTSCPSAAGAGRGGHVRGNLGLGSLGLSVLRPRRAWRSLAIAPKCQSRTPGLPRQPGNRLHCKARLTGMLRMRSKKTKLESQPSPT